jgi:hypothetical protein
VVKKATCYGRKDIDEICEALKLGHALECNDDIWLIARSDLEHRGVQFETMWQNNIVYLREDYTSINTETDKVTHLTKKGIHNVCNKHTPKKLHLDKRKEIIEL